MPLAATFEEQKARAIQIGVDAQRERAQDVAEIRQAVEIGEGLQSWPVALGGPDSQQFRAGAIQFGARWYLAPDPVVRAKLEAGSAALYRLQGAIQSQCNLEGIDIAFTNHGPRIRVPAPDVEGVDVRPDSDETSRAPQAMRS